MNERTMNALTMVDAFVSIGSRRFDLTRTTINREPVDYCAGRNVGAMRILLPVLVPLVWTRQENLIIRPQKPMHGVLVQLDDLAAGQLERVRSRSFLIVETSVGNYQVWIAIEDGDVDFIKRLMKGVGADSRANCAGRLAGTPNCKKKYAPDFPAVRIAAVQPGMRAKGADLEDLAAPAVPSGASAPAASRFHGTGSRGWPDYERCLAGAPKKPDGTPDRSRADYMWCIWALERGNSAAAVEVKLLEVSAKAREEWDRGNQEYVRRTVEAATKAG